MFLLRYKLEGRSIGHWTTSAAASEMSVVSSDLLFASASVLLCFQSNFTSLTLHLITSKFSAVSDKVVITLNLCKISGVCCIIFASCKSAVGNLDAWDRV